MFDIAGNTAELKNQLFNTKGEFSNFNYAFLDIPKLYVSSHETIELITSISEGSNLSLLNQEVVQKVINQQFKRP